MPRVFGPLAWLKCHLRKEKMKVLHWKMHKSMEMNVRICYYDGKRVNTQQNIVKNAKDQIVNILLILNFDIV